MQISCLALKRHRTLLAKPLKGASLTHGQNQPHLMASVHQGGPWKDLVNTPTTVEGANLESTMVQVKSAISC